MRIIVKLAGGLGNQLFQLAFARAKTLMSDERTVLDTSELNRHSKRNVLPWLKGNDECYLLPSSIETKLLGTRSFLSNHFSNSKPRKILVRIPDETRYKLPFYNENYRQFVYDFTLKTEGYFSGTFASFLYWNEFNLDELFNWIHKDIHTYTKFSVPRQSFGVGLHARRGDYFNDPKTRSFHGFCGMDYFEEALSELHDLGYTKRGVLISSDDSSFSEELCNLAKAYSNRVELAPKDNPYLSLMQLNYCDASIGSNSTFSFWASYLQPKQMRIFPANWFLSPKVRFEASVLLTGTFVTRENKLYS